MTKTRIPYVKPSITELEIRYATDAVANGWGDRCYEYISRFESAFKSYLGVENAIATSSCTGALHMGLAAMGIGPGDEVILADINWIASAAPITYLGAQPVLVDIDPRTWCIDPNRVEEAITKKTRAILAVHLYGNLCTMDALQDIGRRYNIAVIEDAAEAIGSRYRGKFAGSMGRFGVFSFHGTKTITTGEGGMFVTDDDDLYESVLTISNHGRARTQAKQFWSDRIGHKYKMSNVQAAIGCAQMERVDELTREKIGIYQMYKSALATTGVVLNPSVDSVAAPGYWMVNAVFPEDCMDELRRERLINELKEVGADARVFFWPLSLTGHFASRHSNPVSHDIYRRAINLPSGFGMSSQMISDVADVVRRFAACSRRPSSRGI